MRLLQIFFLGTIFFCSIFCVEPYAQPMEREYALKLLDSVIQIAQEQSLYADRVDWETYISDLYVLAADQDSSDVFTQPVKHLLTELGDFHGSLMYAYQSGFRGTAKRPTRKNPLAWVDSTSQAIYRTRIPVPYRANTHFFEEERIAYLEVMGTAAMDNELILAGIDSIRTKVCELAARKPIGWILDLRANAGGNVHPMMSGLGDLIPDANLGGDTKNGKGLRSNWRTEEARFYMDGWSAAGELGATCPELVDEQSQIAILASRYTASSGEVVVSSFKGQINTRVFGERTSGYSTTNGWFVLDEDWIFMPALAYYQSVDGTIHQDGILPEEEIIEELDLNNLLEGKTIEAAKRWLKME